MNDEMIIDFVELRKNPKLKRAVGLVMVGREEGSLVRSEIQLDQQENKYNKITVKIPNGTYAIGNSFFCGMFGASVQKLKTADAFFSKFSFEGAEHITKDFRKSVDQILGSRFK